MTWDSDKYLVRFCEPDVCNLALGEPVLLQKEISYMYHESYENCSELGSGYPQTLPVDALRLELEKRHPGQHIVVTCGAKQALHAVAYALKAQGKTHLGIQPPYWPTFPTIANYAGLSFLPFKNRVKGIPTLSPKLLGYPKAPVAIANFWVCNNNPDGDSAFNPDLCYDVVDAAYASDLYGWDGVFPRHTTSIWSASKLLGLSGVRVGWLVTSDSEIAEKAAQYVEQTTSGVATNSQEMVGILLNRMSYIVPARALKDVREKMLVNGGIFNDLLGPRVQEVRGLPANGKGMFAWFKTEDDASFSKALKKAGVLMIPGKACGEKQKGWWRASMCQENDVTLRALQALKKELK